jgi:hypothetical protein
MCLQRVEVAPALKEEESQFVFAIEVYRMLDATILFSRSVNMIEADTAQFADRLASATASPTTINMCPLPACGANAPL